MFRVLLSHVCLDSKLKKKKNVEVKGNRIIIGWFYWLNAGCAVRTRWVYFGDSWCRLDMKQKDINRLL